VGIGGGKYGCFQKGNNHSTRSNREQNATNHQSVLDSFIEYMEQNNLVVK
jgi:hypothetical protein